MRGILRGVLSAFLLAGCGGVEADANVDPLGESGPRADEGGDVSASVLLKCDDLDGTSCPSTGANPRSCKIFDDGGHAWCYCDGGSASYWRCYY